MAPNRSCLNLLATLSNAPPSEFSALPRLLILPPDKASYERSVAYNGRLAFQDAVVFLAGYCLRPDRHSTDVREITRIAYKNVADHTQSVVVCCSHACFSLVIYCDGLTRSCCTS
jgi:hypothetical protein